MSRDYSKFKKLSEKSNAITALENTEVYKKAVSINGRTYENRITSLASDIYDLQKEFDADVQRIQAKTKETFDRVQKNLDSIKKI